MRVFGNASHLLGTSSNISGCCPDVIGQLGRQLGCMASYLLEHRHDAPECGVVFAAFKGHESPLRRQGTLASCRSGGHAIWWTVDAESESDALALLPFYVAQRTTATRVSKVDIP
jgi:hypothetical protein